VRFLRSRRRRRRRKKIPEIQSLIPCQHTDCLIMEEREEEREKECILLIEKS